MKKIKYLLLVLMLLIPMIVFADTTSKPSITVKIKNLNTTNYLVDLFVYDESKEDCQMNYNGDDLTEEQIKKLYDLNYDGWISASTRWNCKLLFANVMGNDNYENTFSYFGTPTKYKVLIINNDTGEIKISQEIIRQDFNSTIEIDYNSMDTTTEINNNKTIINVIISLVVTVILEVIIAIIFKIKDYKLIILVNILTNIILQTLLLLLSKYYLITFIVGEFIVIISELIIYMHKMKNVPKNKIIWYTLIANIITILLTLLFC